MNKPKLKVVFDAGPLANGQKSGVGYYTYRLIDALASQYPDQLQMTGHFFNFAGRKHPTLPRQANLKYRSSQLLPGKVLSVLRRAGLQFPFNMLVKARGDVALFPNFVSLPVMGDAKKVVVIHDLCFEDYPEYLQPANRQFLKRFVPRSVRSADLVIAVSQSTKASLIRHYALSEDKIIVTPIPPDPPAKNKVAQPDFDLPDKFILFLSTLEPRKNYLNLVKAYTQLPPSLKKDYGLVLAGGLGWDSEEPMSLIKKLQENGEKIYVTGYVSDEARSYLFQNASLFVMPSHYEGFGMPILEAMSYNVPTAVGDIPVFHEVSGEASLYFDKDDPEDIAKKLEQILSDAKLQKALIENGRARLKLFSWEDNARRLMEAFQSLVGKGGVSRG